MAGDSVLTATPTSHGDNAELLQTIAQLEKRIRELEHGTAGHATNGDMEGQRDSETAEETSPELSRENEAAESSGREHQAAANAPVNEKTGAVDADRLTVLLGKGQSLLDSEKADEALICFNEALTLEPANPEALVKKGTALERLRKLNEAIECYDRAIQADSTMTIAYLYKGGLCNRMERFNEALQCYEQALRTQEKRAA
jgi:tetratricopeptide (TPR) repeat protein